MDMDIDLDMDMVLSEYCLCSLCLGLKEVRRGPSGPVLVRVLLPFPLPLQLKCHSS